MPGTKEIRSKIASVKSTQKITKAMEMVAASKMRRAQERMRWRGPYAAQDAHRDRAPDTRPTRTTAIRSWSSASRRRSASIVISTDRGLCGGLNANVFKQTLLLMREWQGKGAQREPVPDRQQGRWRSSAASGCRYSPASRAWAIGRTSRI